MMKEKPIIIGVCKECKADYLPMAVFYNKKYKRWYRRSRCVVCENEIKSEGTRKWRKENPDKEKAAVKKYRQENKEWRREYMRKYMRKYRAKKNMIYNNEYIATLGDV